MLRLTLTISIALAVSTTTAVLAQSKTDLFGFSPGVPVALAKEMVQQKQMTCEPPQSDGTLTCNGNMGDIRFFVAQNLPNSPVTDVDFNWYRRDASFEQVVANVSEQYGQQPVKKKVFTASWALPNGSALDLFCDPQGNSCGLQLSSPTLKDQAKAASAAKASKDQPKF
ncbi:hypothetical protein JQ631_12530 [Bradyrhizobium manausense]|uniref:hypothetical protein n=1 Tax=Bradyrhizobium manausense TaxID=989370 RepID=UPI001BA9A3A0|nr:hypothetical protein [Bradyrhizobium manausense]MBR0789903.1 hypothetical protein [Bradyrhizobium manausense]